jgi:hypothetical protein
MTYQIRMKKLLLTILFTVATFSFSYAQDLLIMNNGTEIRVKVQELTVNEIKFKKWENIDGPLYTLLKTDVFMIKYENGTKDTFARTVETRNDISLYSDDESLGYDRIRYNGPRVGVTVFGDGSIKDDLKRRQYQGVVSQFGWQLETRLFTAPNETSGLVEWVFLVGGVEQGLFLPSASMLFGIRGKEGFEFGMGPNLSVGGVGMVFAVGGSIKSGKIVYPINLALVPSVKNAFFSNNGDRVPTGIRVSLLVGFNTRVR